MILLIDNYDSFVHNLARYLRRLGQETLVVRNDAIDVARIRQLRPAAIVLSPGPCTPDEAGCSLEVVRKLHTEFPILGVCLGHQTIGQAFGARIVRAGEPMHGRTSEVFHAGESVFASLPSPLNACRYHSLIVERATLPPELEVIAQTADDLVMAIAHRRYPIVGVQFHPEAILTEGGYTLLANFLQLVGVHSTATIPGIELSPRADTVYLPPTAPVTF